MRNLSRRELLASAGFAALSMSVRANPLGLPIGCQTYPVRDLIGKDFEGTIRQLSAAGFESIELCSPKGYGGGFASVGKYSGAQLQQLFADCKVSCQSSHFSIGELRKDLPGRIAWAKEAGLTQMLVPSLDGPHPTMDRVKSAAEEFNKMGEQVQQAGMQLGLHNEDFEISQVDGQRTYDLLFKLLDPKLIKFQFQCSTISDGYVAADYFEKYPGRFISMHVQDWSPTLKKEVAVGKGSIDWKRTFEAAKTGGIQNYFVEMQLDLMKESVPYLKQLQV